MSGVTDDDRTLILGLGNPLRGDDGLATAVLDALTQMPLPPAVTLLDSGTPGLDLLLLWEGYSRVIIVDAALMDLPPGTWRRFVLADVIIRSENTALQGTLHAAGLAEALALADALEALPEQLIIYGVQPQDVAWRPGLSAAVAATIPEICTAICQEITKPPAAIALPEAASDM